MHPVFLETKVKSLKDMCDYRYLLFGSDIVNGDKILWSVPPLWVGTEKDSCRILPSSGARRILSVEQMFCA